MRHRRSRGASVRLHRNFGFFSEVIVEGPNGDLIGTVKQRFSRLRRRRDLLDSAGRTFPTIAGALMKRWSFPIDDLARQQRGEISKPYAGYTQEMVTEARRFKIDFVNHHWTLAQREGRQSKIGLVALGD